MKKTVLFCLFALLAAAVYLGCDDDKKSKTSPVAKNCIIEVFSNYML